MIVAPAAGGQALQLQMRVEIHDVAAAVRNVAGVVEDRRGVGILAHGFFDAAAVFGIDHLAVARNVGRIVGIQAQPEHGLDAAGAHAAAGRGNIQEHAAGMIALHDLFNLRAQLVQIGRVVAHQVIVRLGKRRRLNAVGIHVQPFGMIEHFLLIEARGQIDRRVHADFAAGLELRAQQVEREVRVHLIGRGGMIRPAVMALGKHGDGIDMAGLERTLELLLRERAADAGDLFRGVEIEVNLSHAHGNVPLFVCRGGGLKTRRPPPFIAYSYAFFVSSRYFLTSSSNAESAVSTEAGSDISTPATFSRSIGCILPPSERNFL